MMTRNDFTHHMTMIIVRVDNNFSGTLWRTCREHVIPILYVVIVVITVHMTTTDT